MSPRSHVSLVFTPPPSVPLAPKLTPLSWRALAFSPQPSARLTVERVRGDGRCLYRSIAKALAFSENRRLPEHLERADADALRKMAYKALCVDRFDELRAKGVVEGSLRRYCMEMRNTTFYAGEAEMLVLADVLKTCIRVYLNTGRGLRNIVSYGERWAGKKSKDVNVLYNGKNHYDAIRVSQ